MKKIIASTFLLSLVSLADTVTPFEEITASGFAMRIIDSHVLLEGAKDEESDRNGEGNDPMLVISKHFLSDRSISESLKIAHALSVMAKLPEDRFGERATQIRVKLERRLKELEDKTVGTVVKKEAPRIFIGFRDNEWLVWHYEVDDDSNLYRELIYPACRKITLLGRSLDGTHVLKNEKLGISFDVIENTYTTCWFESGRCVDDGHWHCGPDCTPPHEKVELKASAIEADVWQKLYDVKNSVAPKNAEQAMPPKSDRAGG